MKHKLKPQWDITTHLSEWLKFKIVTSNTKEDTEKLDRLYFVYVNVEWYSHSGKLLSSFFKTKTQNYDTTQKLHSWAFIPANRKLMFTPNLYRNVNIITIHNCPKAKTPKMSFNGEWLNKLCYICSREGLVQGFPRIPNLQMLESLTSSLPSLSAGSAFAGATSWGSWRQNLQIPRDDCTPLSCNAYYSVVKRN